MPQPSSMDATACILSHPILVRPAAGEYADGDEDCMVVGDFAKSIHLFQSILIPEVHDSIKALPSGPLPCANSVVLMKAEDFEKMRSRYGDSKKRSQAPDNNNTFNPAAEMSKMLKTCHEARTRVITLEAEVKERDEKLAKLRQSRDVRTQQLGHDLCLAHTQLAKTQAELAACRVDLATQATKSKIYEILIAMLKSQVDGFNTQVQRLSAEIVDLRNQKEDLERKSSNTDEAALEALNRLDVLDLVQAPRG